MMYVLKNLHNFLLNRDDLQQHHYPQRPQQYPFQLNIFSKPCPHSKAEFRVLYHTRIYHVKIKQLAFYFYFFAHQ